jgi:hypothetical protein
MAQLAEEKKKKEDLDRAQKRDKKAQEKLELKEKIARLRAENLDKELNSKKSEEDFLERSTLV